MPGEGKAEIGEVLPAELVERLSRGERPLIVDVRDPAEVAIAPFPDAMHIPMDEIPGRLNELDPSREIIVLCHHGIRSAQVATYLVRLGYEHVSNLRGGIDLWSVTVDPALPRY